MGVFDSKSNSNTTSQNVGFSEVDGPASSVSLVGGGKGSVSSVSVTDGGAISGALQLSRELSLAALDFGRTTQLGNAALSAQGAAAANDLVKASYSLADSARQSETSGAINNVLKYGAIVLGLAIAAWALRAR